ncbi:MAG: RNA polymerase subunit sigma-24 [Candidatus Rokuibacteriota bacterium]|nr:MAG: RNA polymerase subunit sigma-24 [Candidatus Rokubacteria bacterium]
MLGINGLRLSDTELVERLREGDADAAETLINTYGAQAHRLAVRITGSEADAEEIVQDALWTVVRRVAMFRGDAALGTWIHRITANAAYEKLRRRGRRQREVSWDDLPPAFDDEKRHLQPVDDWSGKGGDPAVQTELRTVLTGAIDELRAEYRTVFVLHDMDGMSNPDIAATLDLTVPAVKSRVHRARLLLRRRLRDYLGEISTGPQPDGDPARKGGTRQRQTVSRDTVTEKAAPAASVSYRAAFG